MGLEFSAHSVYFLEIGICGLDKTSDFVVYFFFLRLLENEILFFAGALLKRVYE